MLYFTIEAEAHEAGVPHLQTMLDPVKVKDLTPEEQADLRRRWAQLVAIGDAHKLAFHHADGRRRSVQELLNLGIWTVGIEEVELKPGGDPENPDDYIAWVGPVSSAPIPMAKKEPHEL